MPTTSSTRRIQPTQPNLQAGALRESGVWEGRTLTSFLSEAAAECPERPALVQGDTRLTYRKLWQETQRLAAGIDALRLPPGAVISYILPNWAETVLLHHSVTALGMVNNPIVPIYRHAEVAFIANQARPSLVVIPHQLRGFDYVQMLAELRTEGALPEACRIAVARPLGPLPDGFIAFAELFRDSPLGPEGVDRSRPDEITLLLYTSGTTAAAKGVLHSHETLVCGQRAFERWFNLGADDVVFMASPVTHITGVLVGMQLPTMLRAKLVLQDIWEPVAGADLIEREGCTFTVSATPFLQGLLEADQQRAAAGNLRTFVCGGADVPPELVRAARTRLGMAVVRAYGSTEILAVCASHPDDPIDKAAETDGRPILAMDYRVLDAAGRELGVDQVGELAVVGPERFLGYLDGQLNQDAFTENGYFLTGDLASIDRDGFITIQGRKKDIIIRAGEKISAREVEDLLFEHPAVAEVAVVAMPDPRLGEKACAYVAPVPGAHFDFAEMTRYLTSRRVAKQKFPEYLEILADLPKTASGKVQKFRLREDAAAKARATSTPLASTHPSDQPTDAR